FDPANRDFVAAQLLEELAFGQTSEIYKKLVIAEQKVEFIAADFPLNRDQPLFEICAMVKKEADLPAVRDEIDRTLQRYKTEPVDAKRLDQLKRRHKYAFLMALDSPEAVAGALARFVALSGGIDVVDRLFAEFDRVTADDIVRATRKYFTPERRTVVVLKGAQP
ncbi:MAG: insulinase family protein, partial [Thermoguttaceae bacterium]|nr:insulinase family protein [Thermoguttaceae bacterium]